MKLRGAAVVELGSALAGELEPTAAAIADSIAPGDDIGNASCRCKSAIAGNSL